MKRLKTTLGYAGAILTLLLALLTPFVLLGGFTKAIGALGLKIHPSFSGGEVAHASARNGYQIRVYKRVAKTTPLQRVDPFVQIEWSRFAALPAAVADDVDIDGDGQVDVRVTFKPAELVADVASLNPRYRGARIKGVESFSALVAHVNDAVVVRVPVD